MMKTIGANLFLFSSFLISSTCFGQVPILNTYDSPLPKVVAPGLTTPDNGVAAPSDAISLFGGVDLSEWTGKNGEAQWAVHDGMFTVTKGSGDINTKKEFGDFQLHIEFMHPADITGEGQMRGNSGIFLQGLYEIQVLETYNNANKTYVNGQAGSIYRQHPPLVNPLKKPGEWNAYDIVFTSPTFNADQTYRTNPRVTILLYGILVQNNAIIYGCTSDEKIFEKLKGGIRLQDHGCVVNYRNIWVREL
jgi:hypothetical protein